MEERLSELPALVPPEEVLSLHDNLSQVERGEAFLLQAGDCAESFSDLQASTISETYELLVSLASTLEKALKKPIVKVGRIAGQFSKPRSQSFESQGDQPLPVYRGDMINGFEATREARRPDPERMEKAYFHAMGTLNQLKRLNQRGRPLFTSHEALHLPYEQALTRSFDQKGRFYAGSAHFLWVGHRTRGYDGAHIEYARGILNPVGLKCGPDLSPEELVRLAMRLNPENESGRLVLIPRMGIAAVSEQLPKLVRRMRQEGLRGIWCCDPMHGNTYVNSQGFKTRAVEDLARETESFFSILRAEGAVAGGVHLEVTSRPVIECVDRRGFEAESRLNDQAYETLCDPRLNSQQAQKFFSQAFVKNLIK